MLHVRVFDDGAAGMSMAATATSPSGQGNDTHRCGPCLEAIGLLVPHVPNRLWELNLIDKTAYCQWCQRVAAMNGTELFDQAALVHRRLRAAYEVAVWLMERPVPRHWPATSWPRSRHRPTCSAR